MDYVLNLAPYGNANPVTVAPPWAATLGSAAARVNGGTIFYPVNGTQAGWTYGNSALGVDGSNDSIVTITVGGTSFTSYSVLITMLKSDGAGYIFRINPFTVQIIRAPVGGLNTSFVVLNTFSTSVANTDVYILTYNRITGLLSGFKNGTSIITTTDTTYLSDDLYGGFAAQGYNNFIGVTAATIYNLVVREVTSINSGNPFTASQTSSSAITTGFTGLPTSITATWAGGSIPITNIGGSTNAPTFTKAVRVDGSQYPKDGEILTLTFINGSEVANGSQTFNKDADEVELAVTSPIIDDPKYLFGAIYAATGRTAVTGDYGYYKVPVGMSDLTIGVDGRIQVTNAGTFQYWAYTAATGVNYYYSVTITENGVVIGGGLTSSGLTVSGLTIAGLTSSGL